MEFSETILEGGEAVCGFQDPSYSVVDHSFQDLTQVTGQGNGSVAGGRGSRFSWLMDWDDYGRRPGFREGMGCPEKVEKR